MLTTLMLTAALAADAPPAPPAAPSPPPALDELETRRLAQAERLRTAGVALSLTGPVVGTVGLGLLVAGALGQNEPVAIGGFVLGSVGAVASVSGPALLLGGGQLAGAVAWRAHGLPVDATLGWVSGGLFVGSVAAAVFLIATPELWWVPVALYGGGVVTGWVWTNQSVRAASAPPVAVRPVLHPGGASVVVSGRF